MAATGRLFHVALSFAFILPLVSCLFEDQAGTFDWRRQYVGKVTDLYWEQQPGTSGGKRLYVGTDKNVIAAINAANGQIAWRRVFEEGNRGRLDTLLYNTDVLLSVLGGRRVAIWNPASGNLLWDVFLPGQETFRGRAAFVGDKAKGLVVALTYEGMYGLSQRDGTQKWEVSLPERETVDFNYLTVTEGTIYVVGFVPGSEVKVKAINLEGSLVSERSVSAGWMSKSIRCTVVQDQFLLCYCPDSESFQVLDLANPQSFKATAVQDLGISEDKIQVSEWRESFATATSSGGVVRLTADHSALVTINGQGLVQVKKNLPKVVLATLVRYDDRDFLLSLSRSGHEELTMTAYDVAVDEEIPELTYKTHYSSHNGLPAQMSGLLARKKDARMAYKLAVLSDDFSLQLIHKTGKVAWRREESLAYCVAVEMVDLPVSENQAKFEDEFGSHEDNILTMFGKRITTQLSQLKTFVAQQWQHLQGSRHHSSLVEEGEEEEEEEEDLLRDEFNLHKMIVIVTAAGKVIGMRSVNGHIVWQHYIPELAPFSRFGAEKVLLYIQRTTAHFPHPPQCAVLGKNKKSGRGHLFAFNPITGERVEGMPAGGQHMNYNVVQAFMLGEMNEHFLKGIVIIDDAMKVHTYPSKLMEFVRHEMPSLFVYIVDVDGGMLNGHRIVSHYGELVAEEVWNLNLQKKQQTITNIVAKRTNEHVHSQGRVLGDRSVLYKYLNPNVVVVVAEGEEMSSQQKVYPFFNIYLIDTVTGHIVFHGNHRRAKGPITVLHSENWVVYSYYNQKQRRHEMAVLEMYEGKEQSNATAFSSFGAPLQPLVMRQSYIFPLPLYSMTTTITEKGITSKQILIALKTGGIFALPKAFLDPRRPLMPTQETMEEGTIPYMPELGIHTEAIINYNQTLFDVQGIYTAPAGLESTSLVLAYGLDHFHTRVQPSKMFDVLKEDFEYWLITCVLCVMLIVSFITQKLAARKALNRAWK